MLSTSDPTESLLEDNYGSQLQHFRVRHLTGIIVQNLTPFPRRDTVASTLQKPSIASAKALEGAYVADDADLALSSRRSRNLSSASSTHRTLRLADDREISGLEGVFQLGSPGDSPRRARISGKPSTHLHGAASSSISQSPPTFRRQRSLSQASHLSMPTSHLTLKTLPSSPDFSHSSIYSSVTQRSMESVVDSRLIETFCTISSIPLTELTSLNHTNHSPPTPSTPTGRFLSSRLTPHGKRGSSVPNTKPSSIRNDVHSNFAAKSPSISHSRASHSLHSPTLSSSFAKPASETPPTSRAPSPYPPETPRSSLPFFISQVHRPSTHPRWLALDAEREFLPSAPLQAVQARITIWGNPTNERAGSGFAFDTEKGKQRSDAMLDIMAGTWRPILEWDVDLDAARPLPSTLSKDPSLLAPNTLLLKLGPHDNLFYFPPPSSGSTTGPTGHVSDGEADPPTPEKRVGGGFSPSKRTLASNSKETRKKPSAGWQDLVQLATLETVLADTHQSLDDVLNNTNEILDHDYLRPMERQSKELCLSIRSLERDALYVSKLSTQVTNTIALRRAALRKRRSDLEVGQGLLRQDQSSSRGLESLVIRERERLAVVTASIVPHRDRLARTVDLLFPIEPFSTGELLFSILGVPLPLPNGVSDPAPPLTLPSHPSINEDMISTALGYAAQVVQLLGVYASRILPYPITYAGSRSTIKDPISTMQGPRVFPLFSKGVETYRFEYAVFLLNKDIEMLMADRDLRAMDMRHTLPNLKNLLLTMSTETNLDTSGISVAPSLTNLAELPEETTQDPLEDASDVDRLSASTTPSGTPRRQFLSPIAAMLRVRYSSVPKPPASLDTSSSTPHAESEVPLASQDHATALDNAESSASVLSNRLQELEAQPESYNGEEVDEDARTERGVPIGDSVTAGVAVKTKESYGYGIASAWGSLSWLREKDKERGDAGDVKNRPEPPPPPLHKVTS